jgi:outer membrane lipoprotein-sorting protein
MPYNKINSFKHSILILCLLITTLLFSGCAGKRWAEPLEADEKGAIEALVKRMQAKELQCPQSFDADMKMFWKTPLEDRAVEGYLQLLAPSFLKLVISNPLGQPVFAFSGDGKTFQLLEPTRRKHIRGVVRSIAIRNEIPLILAQGDWFAYLTGRLPDRQLTILEILKDKENATIWLQIAIPATKNMAEGKLFLHLAPLKEKVLGYLFLDDTGNTLAEFSYLETDGEKDRCTVQNQTVISGLPWGAEIRIEMKNLSRFDRIQKRDFTLPVPRGFSKQLWP